MGSSCGGYAVGVAQGKDTPYEEFVGGIGHHRGRSTVSKKQVPCTPTHHTPEDTD